MTQKKKYCVAVHFDCVFSAYVVAESEEEAIRIAEEQAEQASLDSETEVVDINSCIIYADPIQ